MKKVTAIILVAVLVLALCMPFLFRFKTNSLIKAINNGDYVKVEEILSDGLDPNKTSIPPSNFWSFFEMSAKRPLSEACSTGGYEMVKLLIDYGARAEYVDNTGWSPLRSSLFHYYTDSVKIIELLLNNGADPHRDNTETYAHPVFSAASMLPKNFDVPYEERSEYDEESARGITEIVKLLLKNESIDIKSIDGQTILICATKVGNVHLVEYILACGCDKNIIDSYGKTALDYAIETENEALIELLR